MPDDPEPEAPATVPTDELLVETDDGIAVVTLNRPARRNALSSSLIRSLLSTVRDLDSTPGIGAIVLTGADPAFCAGLDLSELGSGGNELGRDVVGPRNQHGPFGPMSTVLIGAVNGPAITGGLEIALACDFLVASERAIFADTHARLGILPTWGLTVRLPEAVGVRRAREMSALGTFVDAPTALTWGLVNHVVPHADLLETARTMAHAVSEGDGPAIAAMLDTYRRGLADPGDAAWEAEWQAAHRWQAGGIDPDKVAARRTAVIERGRAQL